MKKIDILILIEHIAREMDVVCALKIYLEKKYNLKVEVHQIYLHTDDVMRRYNPKVIPLPFFYNSTDLAIKEYTKRWPDSIFFNLAWEEIFYKGHMKIKAPTDDFAKNSVIHHSWGNFFKEYLVENGVNPSNIFVNGNPVYQLYLDPYKKFYNNRIELSKKYNLDNKKRWILVPENYRWAFITDNTIKWRVSQGADYQELIEMREYCRKSLKEVLIWCNNIKKNSNIEIIFRPKPVTMLKEMEEFFKNNVSEYKMPDLHFIKEESVREWILASDIIISAFSTTLIEASIAGKPVYLAEPLPIIGSFYADWYKYVNRIKNVKEFEKVCNNDSINNNLKKWAEEEMLSNGDPIKNLSTFLYSLIKNYDEKYKINLSEFINNIKWKFKKKKNYFNQRTHENDIFDDFYIKDRVNAWSCILKDIV